VPRWSSTATSSTFLDIDPQYHFDPLGAPLKLRRVFRDNADFWDALRAFAAEGTVVLTLGNHDPELAMPACQAMLRRRIGGSLVLAFDGAGYRCRVGRAIALFLHGNNEDPWNVIDFGQLGRIATAVNTGAPPEAWRPNEGTRLVIELLNEQKVHHPFIGYLKPEEPLLMELIAKLGFGGLAPQYRKLAPRQVRASIRYGLRGMTRQAVYLGGAGASSTAAAPITRSPARLPRPRRPARPRRQSRRTSSWTTQ
jgi:hypothetical protein